MSDSDTIIKVENLSKVYRIWETPSARLKSPLLAGAASLFPKRSAPHRTLHARAARGWRDFYALRDISFTVRRGEAVGIIGRNGSGKSTLLQIIAGTLQPTTGSVTVKGRVAALLELGSGFNPDFTGRENVFLNGAVHGLSPREMEARFDGICTFADIGDFIEQPVKTYSSGMLMRLAFAVQTAVEPELLIVDEALSVGDAPFQAKCFAHMRKLIEQKVSILFVSHDIGTIRNFCQTAVCLSHGTAYSMGSAKKVCDDYELLCMKESGLIAEIPREDKTAAPAPHDEAPRKQSANNLENKEGCDDDELLGRKESESIAETPREDKTAPPAPHDEGPWKQSANNLESKEFMRRAGQQRAGNGDLRIVDCMLVDLNGHPRALVEYNEEILIYWLIRAHKDFDGEVVLALTVKTVKGTEVLSAADKRDDHSLKLCAGQFVSVSMRYRFPLKGGPYYFTTSLFAFPHQRKFEHGTINHQFRKC
jgi:lipopolysaccharide transport system ATP-binding protein